MSDPTRLIDEAGPDALERDLLRAGRPMLAAHERDEVWVGLSAQLAPSGQGAGGAAKTAAGAKLVAAVKGAIVIAALGGGAVVGVRALGHANGARVVVSRAASSAASSAASLPPDPIPAATAPALAPPLVVAPRPPRPRAPNLDTPSQRLPTSRLAAEGRVVLDARQALRDGRPDEALRRLEAARVEFRDGALAQEREALTIEALARAGRRDDARARATAFLRAHPESPHAAAVRSFAAP